MAQEFTIGRDVFYASGVGRGCQGDCHKKQLPICRLKRYLTMKGGGHMAVTKIEWASHVWNPVTGCTQISEGCQNCYAERMAYRLKGRCGYPKDEPFRVTLHPDRLEQPLKWRKPRKVFVCSMGDLFHEDVPSDFTEVMFGIMSLCPQHTFIVLTKRAQQMEAFFRNRTLAECRQQINWYFDDEIGPTEEEINSLCGNWPLPNVIGMVTAENQKMADIRIPYLLNTPFVTRGVSVEPMLGPVNLSHYLVPKNIRKEREDGSISLKLRPSIKWVIAGGESGPGARPIHPDWVRDLRRQCQNTCTAFFFKSWGEYCYPDHMPEDTYRKMFAVHNLAGNSNHNRLWKVGKKAAGRYLDSRTWDEYPKLLMEKKLLD